MDREKIKDICFSGDSNLEFVFLHGYTGSTSDFADIPRTIHHMFDANIWVPMLPGHGTSVEDLKGVTLSDLIHKVEAHIAERVRCGKKVVLVGLSLGAQTALYLASKHEVEAVVAIATTHKLKFPLTVPGIEALFFFKDKWTKILTDDELRLRANAFYYKEMLSDGFFISKELKKLVEAGIKNIRMPVLFIHSSDERLGDLGAILELSRRLASKKVAVRSIQNESHNMFYSSARKAVEEEIISFVSDISNPKQSSAIKQEKATAIVAAYNEAPRIGKVLSTLLGASLIDEIIVVDDGSVDNTENVLEDFPKVRYIKNDKNLGKGASMDVGVQSATNDILFFCDADLVGFKPEHADTIISNIVENTYDMFIGVRGNFMQRAVMAWGLNSGERALRRNVWDNVAQRDKHRFRIEVALNSYVRRSNPHGLGWKVFDYSQTLKETKYGVLQGTFLRWWMNLDVVFSYITSFFAKNNKA